MVASVAGLPKRQHIARLNSFANLLRGLVAPILFSYVVCIHLVFIYHFDRHRSPTAPNNPAAMSSNDGHLLFIAIKP